MKLTNKNSDRSLARGLFLSLFLAAPVFGARLAYEGFDYAEADGTSVSGLGGGTGWDAAFPAPGGSITLQPGMSYPGLATTGKGMRWTPNSQLGAGRAWADTAAAPADGTYWFSVLVRGNESGQGNFNWMYSTLSTNGQNGIGFRMSNDGTSKNFKPVVPTTDGAGSPQAGGLFPRDTPVLVVGRLNLNTTTGSTWRIWTNPALTPGTPPTDSDPNSAQITLDAANSLTLRAAITGRAFSTSPGYLEYDEVRVGESFAEVLPPSGAELSVSPLAAIENQSVSLSWAGVPPTATAIELDPGDIDVLSLTTGGAGGTTVPAPAAETTFVLTYTDGGVPTSVEAEFTAIEPSFTVPDTGYLGDTLTVNWHVPVGSTAVTLDPGAIDLTGLTSGTDGTGSTTIPAPAATTNYTLSYTSGGSPFALNDTFTLLPSFVDASPGQIISTNSPVTVSWRIDPAFSVDLVNPGVTLEIGPVGGPYNSEDVTGITDTSTGAGSFFLNPSTGEEHYRILFHVNGAPQVVSDTIQIFPQVFELGVPLNNTKPVQTNPLPMFDGVTAYSDRGHVWAAVPQILQGAQFVKMGQDDKLTTGLEIPFTATVNGTFFLLLDNRVGDDVGGNNPAAGTDNPPTLGGGVMDWVLTSGFVDSGIDVGLDESPVAGVTTIDQSYSVYFRQVSQGETFTFFDQANGAFRNMYGIAAVSPQVTPVAFVANPSVILENQGSTLQWTVPVGSTVSIDQGIGDVTSSTDPGTGVGSLPILPAATTTYTLTYDPPGAGTPPVALAPFTVTVNRFAATPDVIVAGESSTLDWIVPAGSTAVSINQGVGDVLSLTNGSGAGSIVVSPTANTAYTLTYTGPGATTPTNVGPVTVFVTPATPFVITSISVAANSDVSFSWPAPAGVTDPLDLVDVIERSTTLEAGSWTDITATGSLAIIDGVVSFTDTDPPAGGKAFYRIVRP